MTKKRTQEKSPLNFFDDLEINELKAYLQEMKIFLEEDQKEEGTSSVIEFLGVLINKLEDLLKNVEDPNVLPLPKQVEIMAYITLLNEFMQRCEDEEMEDDDRCFDDLDVLPDLRN